jgi:hypothetical protein
MNDRLRRFFLQTAAIANKSYAQTLWIAGTVDLDRTFHGLAHGQPEQGASDLLAGQLERAGPRPIQRGELPFHRRRVRSLP